MLLACIVWIFPLISISSCLFFLPRFWGLFQIALSTSCSTAFQLFGKIQVLVYIFVLFHFLNGPLVLFIIIIIIYLEFFTSALADCLSLGLSDSKSPQVSRTLLSIQVVLNNAVVWMVSTHPPTSKSSSPFSNPLVTVPKAPITIGIIVTCMFHSFFNSLARLRYLFPSFHILSVLFGGQPGQQSW